MSFPTIDEVRVYRRRLNNLEQSLHDGPLSTLSVSARRTLAIDIQRVRQDVAGWERFYFPDEFPSPERQAVLNALAAMQELEYSEPVTVRSRAGMLRLLTVAYGRRVTVRWSWPAAMCARAHSARPLLGAV